MQFLPWLLDHLAYINPISLAGWMVWLGLAGLLAVALISWRKYHAGWNLRSWGLFAALIFAALVTSLSLGVQFSTDAALPMPGVPEEPSGSTMMIFSAIPWTVAGGLLCPIAAAGVGLISGLLRG